MTPVQVLNAVLADFDTLMERARTIHEAEEAEFSPRRAVICATVLVDPSTAHHTYRQYQIRQRIADAAGYLAKQGQTVTPRAVAELAQQWLREDDEAGLNL